jgi:hypothetical protein
MQNLDANIVREESISGFKPSSSKSMTRTLPTYNNKTFQKKKKLMHGYFG